ncbi:hypothetical protein SeMB42_g02142 [Synchytrium endobioticum]|uniref:Uncharacterized protein n=1 Tax=Synchytrium endobioticum TaxID=286115 RepID=A0A507DHC1_9FUNG|nr:hypothetical protein SeMB42_g02142 [Synchytrium endobioticum]
MLAQVLEPGINAIVQRKGRKTCSDPYEPLALESRRVCASSSHFDKYVLYFVREEGSYYYIPEMREPI